MDNRQKFFIAARRLSVMFSFVLWFALSASPAQPAPVEQIAGASCGQDVQVALQRVSAGCLQVGRNQACYGNTLVNVELRPNLQPGSIAFASVGDVADLTSLRRIVTSPYNSAAGTWGIALLKAQVNLPAALPGENVTFLLFGDTTLNNPLGSMRAFTVETRVGAITCEEMPQSGLLIQSPANQQVRMSINGADVVLGSTAHLTATGGNEMIISLLEGEGHITAFGQERVLTPGSEVWMPLGGENGVTVVEPPGVVRPFDAEEMNRLPLSLLERQITIPNPIVADAAPVGDCTPRTDWTFNYRIAPGDTLGGIAGRAGIPLQELAAGNCIINPAAILAGQTIRVPRAVSPPPAVATSTPNVPNVPTATGTSNAPLTAFMTANPMRIPYGGCTTLTWGVNQTGEVSYSNIDGLPVPLNGSRQECPSQTTTFIFIMAFTDGRASNATVTVEVDMPTVCGNYICEPGETFSSCSIDCPSL